MANESFIVPALRGTTVEALRREVQFTLQQQANRLDELAGKRGTPAFYADVNAQGHRVTNIGAPQATTDAEQRGLSLGRESLTGAWDAQNQPIQNLPPGRGLTESVNLQQVQLLLDALIEEVLPTGMIVLWSGTVASIPSGWQLCDGTNSTPDLRDRFVVGAGSTHNPGDTGGADTTNLAHTHAVGTYANATESAHTHGPGTLGTDTDATGPSATTTVDNNLDISTVTVASNAHTHSHNHSVTTGATAAGSAHTHTLSGVSGSALSSTTENRPAFYALAYIMKVG